MADYIFTQNGDGNVQIGDMTGMPHHVNIALKWALEHNFQSVAAQYARTLAQEVERLRAKLAESQRHRENNQTCYVSEMCDGQRKDAEITALRAENDAFKADIEAGRMVWVRIGIPIQKYESVRCLEDWDESPYVECPECGSKVWGVDKASRRKDWLL